MVPNMKIERIKQELSQNVLASIAGVKQYRISLIERGIEPTRQERAAISEVLKIKITEFPFDEYHPPKPK